MCLVSRNRQFVDKKEDSMQSGKKSSWSDLFESCAVRGVGRFGRDFTGLGPQRCVWGGKTDQTHLEEMPKGSGAAAVSSVQEQLLTGQGQLYEIDRRELPPLFLQYFRSHLASRMQPPMRREALHLSYCLDLALQGQIPEMVDVLA